MRLRSTLLLAFTLALPSLAGCGKSEGEKQMSEMTGKQKEIVSILRTVNDVDSAKAANVKIKDVAKDVQSLLERSKTTKTTESERTRLVEKFKPEQQQITKDAQAELQRIGKIPGASIELMEGLMQLGAAGHAAGASAPK